MASDENFSSVNSPYMRTLLGLRGWNVHCLFVHEGSAGVQTGRDRDGFVGHKRALSLMVMRKNTPLLLIVKMREDDGKCKFAEPRKDQIAPENGRSQEAFIRR
jgi:hypothetical protein